MNDTPGDTTPPPSGSAGNTSPQPNPAAPAGAASPAPGQGQGQEQGQASSDGGFFGGIRRLDIQRDENRWIGGVGAGLARKFDIDPIIIRGLLLLSVVFGGLGLVIYAAAWALLPERSDGRIHAEEMIRGRFDIAIIGAAFMMIAGLVRGNSLPLWWGGSTWSHDMVGTAATIGIIIAVIAIYRHSRQPAAPAQQMPGVVPPGVPGYPGAAPATAATQTSGAPGYTPPPAAAPSAFRIISTPTQEPVMTTPPTPSVAPPTPGGPQGGYQHGGAPFPPAPGFNQGFDPRYGPNPGQGYGPGYRPHQPPALPRERAAGPGRGMAAAVLGITLIAMAVMLIITRVTDLDIPVGIITVGLGVTLTGGAIIASGLRGRRSGGLTGLAIVGVIVALPIAGATSIDHDWSWGDSEGDGSTHTPVTRAIAADGLKIGTGNSTLDLTQVPLNGSELTVPVQVGAGDITVWVPTNTAVTAEATIGIGEVTWLVDGKDSSGGIGIDKRTFTSDEASTGHSRLHLDISVGAGSVTVKEK